MIIVFLHGWSVTHTDTYGKLPEVLQSRAAAFGLDLKIEHVFLGSYISFKDEVTMPDVVKAFDHAIREQIPGNDDNISSFSCITHSTGAAVVREWVDSNYGKEKLDTLPLQHLIMLAPANHGSALAQLGKGRLGRIKAWFGGIEPGKRILDWLELGSKEQWRLNKNFLEYDLDNHAFFPFVLTGQKIDKKLYDHINSYTGEPGSDGVIRVCAANLNYRSITLRQVNTLLPESGERDAEVYRLEVEENRVHTSPFVPLGVVRDVSHVGNKYGIQNSVKESNAHNKPVVREILQCLTVKNTADYKKRSQELTALTEATQTKDQNRWLRRDRIDRYSMFVFTITDHEGEPINDFDMLFLAGKNYDENKLPKGFFKDRQLNSRSRNRLVYYLNYDKMKKVNDGKLGIRIKARPDEGFVSYRPGEFRSEDILLGDILRPNETTYVNVILRRRVSQNVFRVSSLNRGRRKFKDDEPGDPID